MIDVKSSINLDPLKGNSPTIAQHLSVASVVSTIFSVLVPIAGALLLLLLLFGGFTYLTAAGNDEQVAKAKKIITQAIIGIVIVAFSFGIGLWIINTLGISSSSNTNIQIATSQPKSKVVSKSVSTTLTPIGAKKDNAEGVYSLAKPVSNYTQIAQTATGIDSTLNSGTVISPNNGIKGTTTTGTSYDDPYSVTGNSPYGDQTIDTSKSSSGQTIGQGGTIGNTTTTNPAGGITETGTAQTKSCAWYKKVLKYVGLAHCPANINPNQTVVNGSSSNNENNPTATGIDSNNPSATGIDSNGPSATGIDSNPPAKVSIPINGQGDVVSDYSYSIAVTTPSGVVCTAVNMITHDTVITAQLDAAGKACTVNFLDNFVPQAGQVTINTIEKGSNKSISGATINVQGQQAATGTSKGDTNTQYLKGTTDSQGSSTFPIYQAGTRTVTISAPNYASCTKNVLLTAGDAVIFELVPYEGSANSCLSSTYLLTPTAADTNINSSVPTPETNTDQGMPAGQSNPALPQPAQTQTPAGDIYQNLPQPAGATSNTKISIPGSQTFTIPGQNDQYGQYTKDCLAQGGTPGKPVIATTSNNQAKYTVSCTKYKLK